MTEVIIADKIREITEACYQQVETSNLQLLGNGGYVLLSTLTTENADILNHVSEMLEYNLQLQNPEISFANGLAGQDLIFSYLHNENFIDKQTYDLVKIDNRILLSYADRYLDVFQHDFLHGAIGLIHAVLYDYNVELNDVMLKTLHKMDALFLMSDAKNILPEYDFQRRILVADSVNLGLAHGIPSLLKVCLLLYKKNICANDALRTAKKIIQFLRNSVNKETSKSYWPTHLTSGSSIDPFSRLAWCYGDLSIAYILYQAGNLLEMKEVSSFALIVLENCCQRRSYEETNIFDAGICHGSSGVAHIFNRVWHFTKNPLFKEATEFWIKRTLELAIHADGTAGYKKYNILNSCWDPDCSLLEGASGIGLVLHSYLTDDFGWDYCLMLNNLSDDGTF